MVYQSIATVLLLFAAAPGYAHAEYASSVPPRDAVVESAPAEIRLAFTEQVETRFSTFKVYRLTHPSLDGASLVDPDFLRLNGLAGTLVADVLQLRDDDVARVDVGLVDSDPRAMEVVLELEPSLGPGAYVVMWRVLAADTHPTQGHFVFVVAPTAASGTADPDAGSAADAR